MQKNYLRYNDTPMHIIISIILKFIFCLIWLVK